MFLKYQIHLCARSAFKIWKLANTKLYLVKQAVRLNKFQSSRHSKNTAMQSFVIEQKLKRKKKLINAVRWHSEKIDSCLSWHHSDVIQKWSWNYHQSGRRVNLWAALREQMEEAPARNERYVCAKKIKYSLQTKLKQYKIQHFQHDWESSENIMVIKLKNKKDWP